MLARCCRAVSGLLGNTPAVCRASYIHPTVFEAYADGRLAAALPEPEDEAFETALIELLEAAGGAS
jgi:DNA topoisomerase-1